MAKPQATSLDHREAELFRGRTAELAAARGLWATPLRPDQRRILLVTGIGGIGKSALARRIVRNMKDAWANDGWLELAKPAYGAIDLAEAWSHDVVQALLQLRLQVGMTWREARFPLFDFAFARIHVERFPSSDVLRQFELLNPDGGLTRRLAPTLPHAVANSERLQDAANCINELLDETPLIGQAYKYLNRVFAKGLQVLDQRTEPLLKEIASTSTGLLDQRLPECLGMDLKNAIRTAEQRRPVTVVIDTIEALHRSAPKQSGIEASQNDAWLRELVWQAPGVGFVLLGRDDVEWPTFEHSPVRDWASIVEPHRLGALSDPEVTSILEAFPVRDAEVAAAIREGAEGLPFYLGLQLDIHRDLAAEGLTPTPQHFARAPKAVLARFASHLGERLATAFATLAHARRFDASLFQHLKAQPGTLIGPVGLPEITRYSLVEGDADGFFRLHQHYQDIQREELARSRPDDQRQIDQALLAYWDCFQPADLRDVTAFNEISLREAAHHQRLLEPSKHIDWLAARWWPYCQANKLQLVRDLWTQGVQVAKNSNGPQSQAHATALGNLCIVLLKFGDFKSALDLQQLSLQIEETTYGPEHPIVAEGLMHLGLILYEMGDLIQARNIQERVLIINELTYGEESKQYISSLLNLANVVEKMKSHSLARVIMERAINIAHIVYKDDKALLSTLYFSLGQNLQYSNNIEKTLTILKLSLKLAEEAFGYWHPNVASCKGGLANILRECDLFEAKKEGEEALIIFEKCLPSTHHDIGVCCYNLAIIVEKLGDKNYAAGLRARAAAILGSRH